MSASVNGIPAGVPSTTTPSAGPCDSPQVVSRKILPKLLPMRVGLPLHPCGRLPTKCLLSRVDQVRATFRSAPGTEEPVVVRGRAPEAEALVEPLRSVVRALRAQSDSPRPPPSHGVHGQTKRFESESPALLLRDDRDPVEMPPVREECCAEIGHRLTPRLDEPDFNTRCLQVDVKLDSIIAPQPGKRRLVHGRDLLDGRLIIRVDANQANLVADRPRLPCNAHLVGDDLFQHLQPSALIA